MQQQSRHHDVYTENNAQAVTDEIMTLRSQAEHMEQLIDTMPVGVVTIDGNGWVSKANQLAVSLLGEPLIDELWFSIIKRSFRPQKDDGHEVSLQNGRRVKLDIRPLEGQAGQMIILTDLTETRELQKKVGHLQRLSALGKMVASLAHQVRTPLSAALLYASNLGNSTLTAASRQTFHGKLLSRLQDLEQQVNDMLLFSKNGNMEQVEPVSLQNLLTQIHTSSEAMVSQIGGKLSVLLPEPDIMVMGNSTALSSALTNLIHNALEIIGAGAEIKVIGQRSVEQENMMELIVEDNGPGISDSEKERVFEPFFTTRQQGTGLGLSVVKSVINSHQGNICVESSTSGGARFVMTFPIYEEATHAVAANLV